MATFRLAIRADCSCLGVKQDHVVGRVHIRGRTKSRDFRCWNGLDIGLKMPAGLLVAADEVIE
jgi:hypothetical protein